MDKKFNKGDIVVLKSGGPKMTVDGYAWHGNYESNEAVVCFWFDGSKKKEAIFNQETLKPAD